MNRQALTTVVAVVAAFCVGLGWSYYTSTQNSGGVAIVDLDEVARRLGRDKEMVSSIQNTAGALNQQLQAAQQSALKQLNQIKSGLGETPTEEDTKKLIVAQRSANLQLNRLKQQAELRVGQTRQALVSKFRQDAKPVALKVAQQRGFTTVVTANDNVVFNFDENVDITDDVVKLMSAEMPATAKPAAKPVAAKPQAAAETQTASKPSETETN